LGPWSSSLAVAIPLVRPVRDVVARALRDERIRTTGRPVRDADGYTLLSVGTRSCGRPPRGGRFTAGARGLAEPRRTFAPADGAPAVWVRWRASYDGMAGEVGRSSTTCVLR